ncbi:Lysophospholipase 2 [Sphaceloma murrayae]|uniref:Lysophospholipase n=1 Tax=Sphaceloma murrayae TaxID=2082308 RepID=A0A2K1QPG1_9PEZI|nr:Lysophospholipase 2 [Sphaceloma murrayae]
MRYRGAAQSLLSRKVAYNRGKSHVQTRFTSAGGNSGTANSSNSRHPSNTLRWLGWTFGVASPVLFCACQNTLPTKPLLLDSGNAPDRTFGFFSLFQANDAHGKDDAFKSSETSSKSQAPPPQTRLKDGKAHDGDSTTIGSQSSEDGSKKDFLSSLKSSLPGFDVSEIGDKIGDMILPDWFKVLPGFIRKLQSELSMAPGSLAEEIWREAHDPEVNPEIVWDANVRISRELCTDEQRFLQRRKHHVREALAKYLHVPLEEIHPDDVPTIAICGSGGGLRAMVAGTSSLLSTGESGLFDCATYTAGVSGSCWLQTLFYSSIGRQDHSRMIEHLKHRLGIHIAFPPAALSLISQAPTNKYLLSGVVEKYKGLPEADFGLVDIYGLLLAARLMVPKGDLSIDYYDMKVSDQSRYVDHGAYPLPIYTAVRHEIPDDAVPAADKEALKEQAKKEAWFQWFEWTPYEFFCEELEAGIPTYAVGRNFDRGRSVWRENGLVLPELRLPVLMGIWGSAFCATLSHYYKEIRPIMKGLAGFGGIDELIAEKNEDLIKLHPIDPATIPNFAKGMKEFLPSTCPESIHNASHLQLMDAGMSNNLPIYPLLRPGRDVDIIIAFDASADVKKDNWLKVTDGYVRQRGIRGWPMGSGWPSEEETSSEAAAELEQASAHSAEEAEAKVERAQAQDQGTGTGSSTKSKPGLGYCTVWCGTKEERQESDEPPPSKMVEEDWQLMEPDAGVTVVYFPLLPNGKVPGVDPQTSDFLSTWNFVYSPEEIDKVVALARANFEAGKEQTRRTVKAVWERKRKQRLERDQTNRDSRWALNLAKARAKGRYGDQGDHFS